MSYYESVGASGGPYDNADMEMFGRTGQSPDNIIAFFKAMKDPVKKAIYDKAREAAVAKAQTTAVEAHKTAARATRVPSPQLNETPAAPSSGPPKMLLVVGGLALAGGAFWLWKKKRGGKKP
jgi:hypothetical protein